MRCALGIGARLSWRNVADGARHLFPSPSPGGAPWDSPGRSLGNTAHHHHGPARAAPLSARMRPMRRLAEHRGEHFFLRPFGVYRADEQTEGFECASSLALCRWGGGVIGETWPKGVRKRQRTAAVQNLSEARRASGGLRLLLRPLRGLRVKPAFFFASFAPSRETESPTARLRCQARTRAGRDDFASVRGRRSRRR